MQVMILTIYYLPDYLFILISAAKVVLLSADYYCKNMVLCTSVIYAVTFAEVKNK